VTNLDSRYHEKESAWLYQRVAATETDPRKRNLFLQLAAAAEEQAGKWESPSRPADIVATTSSNKRTFVPSLRARIVARLMSHFGPRALRSILAAMKLRAVPLIPFLAARGTGATILVATAALSCLALFCVGLVLSLFTGRDGLKGALRMVLSGAGAAMVSFWVGKVLGVAIRG
jgi:hypothetical protein